MLVIKTPCVGGPGTETEPHLLPKVRRSGPQPRRWGHRSGFLRRVTWTSVPRAPPAPPRAQPRLKPPRAAFAPPRKRLVFSDGLVPEVGRRLHLRSKAQGFETLQTQGSRGGAPVPCPLGSAAQDASRPWSQPLRRALATERHRRAVQGGAGVPPLHLHRAPTPPCLLGPQRASR